MSDTRYCFRRFSEMKKKPLWRIFTFLLICSMLPLPASATGNDVEIVCNDENLYAALTDALNGVAEYDADPDAKRLALSATEAAKVTSLQLNNREIADLSGLGAFPALEELDISNNAPITDLSPLSGLTGLTSLNAYGNAVTDVSPILGLTALESLNLGKNRLNESKSSSANCVTEQLSVLTNLQTLDLSHNVIRYTAGLNRLTELRSLNLYDNAIRDLSGLDGLANLEFLSLGENNETNTTVVAGLDALDSLTAMKSFNFDKNKTPEIAGHLGNMSAMETLSLTENSLTDISVLSNLSALRELILFGNQITDISPLLGLSALETLDFGNNKVETLQGVLDGSGALVWPVLRTLNIAGNWNWNFRTKPESGALFQMFVDSEIELGYTYSRLSTASVDWSHLPHTDADGTTYVTYDDFYARCDGSYDDFIAMRNAHNFANEHHCDEVRANPDKTYHIFDFYEYAVTARTNIDWMGATFVLHDEDIERKYGRYWPLILITNTVEDDWVTIENPGWTIDRSTTKLDVLQDTIAPLNEKGYGRYLCIAQNDGKKQFIRYQTNASSNAGEPQQDRFLMDAECNLLNEVAWDFEQITSFEIVPVPEQRGYVRNGTFVSNAPLSQSETPYTRSGVSKPIYWNRNLQWRKSCNMEISNIRHIVRTNGLCGAYSGILNYSNCADVDTHDCTLFARKCQVSSRSKYDLVLATSVNMRFANIETNDLHDKNRWGVMQSNYCKDVVFEHCSMNRIDAHQGIYNLTVKDCTLGVHALTMTGMGTLNVSGTTFYSDCLMTLRFDYGSTWRGDAHFTDCTLVYDGVYAEKVFNYALQFDPDGGLHDYGYDCHIPNLYIDNLTVDNRNRTENTDLNALYNWDTSALPKTPRITGPAR